MLLLPLSLLPRLLLLLALLLHALLLRLLQDGDVHFQVACRLLLGPQPLRPLHQADGLGEGGVEVEAGEVVLLGQAVQVKVVDGRACGKGDGDLALRLAC